MPSSAAEIRQMLATDEETGEVEFKIKAPRPAELAERICGMANRRSGGTVLFGIENAQRAVVGLARPHQTIDLIWTALRLVKPAVRLRTPDPEVVPWDGKQLVVLQIAPNDGELYQAGNVFWIRKGSHTVAMTREEIETHLRTYGSTTWEVLLCPRATSADLEYGRVEQYLSYRAERSRSQRRYTGREDLLLGLQAAGRDPATQDLRPTHAGMLLFGVDPQLHIPQSEVVCVRYTDSLGAGAYLDRKNFTGTLPNLIDQTAEFLERHMNVGGQIRGFKREDRPEYPLEALREAVTNAVVHRDYSRRNEQVRVFFYRDRIEVHSPGLLLPGITPADLAALRVVSRPRNPILAEFLRDIPGYMEKIGSGIRLMVQEMRRLGLPDPEFIEQHEFVVIFRNGLEHQAPTHSPLNARQVRGLQIVQEVGSISNSEYSAATGVAERTALNDLKAMVGRGILIRRGDKRGARYFLP